MGAGEINSFCFFADLKLGSLIIGFVSLVGNLILLALAAWWMVGGIAVLRQPWFDVIRGYLVASVVFIGIRLAIILVNLIFSVVLLIGINKDKRSYVKGYLLYSCVFLALYLVAFIGALATGISVIYIIMDIFVITLGFYFLIVIRSFYLRMDPEPRQQP